MRPSTLVIVHAGSRPRKRRKERDFRVAFLLLTRMEKSGFYRICCSSLEYPDDVLATASGFVNLVMLVCCNLPFLHYTASSGPNVINFVCKFGNENVFLFFSFFNFMSNYLKGNTSSFLIIFIYHFPARISKMLVHTLCQRRNVQTSYDR